MPPAVENTEVVNAIAPVATESSPVQTTPVISAQQTIASVKEEQVLNTANRAEAVQRQGNTDDLNTRMWLLTE